MKVKRILSAVLAMVMIVVVVPVTGVYAAYENTYTNTGDYRADIIGVARTQIGYQEGSNNSNKYGASFNHNNVSWCAYFVSWCARQAGIPTSVLQTSSRAGHSSSYFNIPVVNHSGACYEQVGCGTNSNYIPKPGDLFFTKSWSHVGLVYYVDGDYFYTIEGNSNNTGSTEGTKVCSNRRYIRDYYFGVPNYGKPPAHEINSSYGTNFTVYPKSTIYAENIFDANHNQVSSTAWIGTSDQCTIHEVYTDGCCLVSYPLDSGGTNTVYSKISLFHIDEPTERKSIIRAWFSDSEYGSTPSQYITKNKYWFCYEMYDENTGDRYNSYTNNSYKITMKIYDPYGNIAFESGTIDSMDKNRIGHTIQYIGEYKGVITITGDINQTITRTISVVSNAKVSFAKSSVNLIIPSAQTDSFAISLSGNWPLNTGYILDYNSNIISASAANSTITVTAIKPGTTTLTMTLVDKNNNNAYISSTSIAITVTNETYTVSYNANGGTGAPSSQIKYHDTPLTLSTTVPTRTGYTFKGWSTSSTASSATYQPGGTFTSNANTTLYAVWQPNPTLSVNSTNSATISTAGEMKYYTFTPSTSGTYVIYSTGSVDTKVYLYNANGTELTNNDDGGENTNFRLEYNFTAGTKYTFGVKYYNSSTTGTISFNFGNIYTISYNANGGSGTPSSQKKDYGAAITLSSTVPTRTGYTFKGWATSSSATSATYQPGSSFSSNATTTLYAVWQANTYTVKYNANGGSGSMSNSTHTYDVSKSLSSNAFTRSGYTFLGWSTSSSATTATYTNSQSVKNLTSTNGATVDLYAVWGKIPTYTISYNANGGSGAPANQTKTQNVNLTLSNTVPTRTGYTFKGWATSSSATSASYQPGSSFTSNAATTLYAVWQANTYTVRYNANGGSGSMSNSTHTYDVSKSLSSNAFTRSGYTFLGWSTSSSATTATYTNGQSVKNLTSTNGATVDLYAVWQQNIVLSSISVYSNPTKTTYYIGDTFSSSGLIIKLTYSDGTTQNITSGFTTSGFSSTTSGTKTITVSYSGKTTTFNISVRTPSISLSSNNTTLNIGDSNTITATTTPSGQTVTWTSSNTNVATVSNGRIIAKNAGTATITAKFTYNGVVYSAICTVTVKAATARGDVNSDGTVDAGDAVLISRYDAGFITLTSEQLKAGDVNGDGAVDAGDAVVISRYDAGFISSIG